MLSLLEHDRFGHCIKFSLQKLNVYPLIALLHISQTSKSISELFQNLVLYLQFHEDVQKGTPHPVFVFAHTVLYVALVYKSRRDKGSEKFISPFSKIVERIRHRDYKMS